MKKTTYTITALALALGLTACGGGVEKSAEPTQVPPASESQAPQESAPMDEDVESAAPVEDDEISERGLLKIKEGEAVDFTGTDGMLTGTMTINKVVPNLKCDVEEIVREAPENGRFVGLDVSVVTPKAGEGSDESFTISLAEWEVIAANGTSMNGSPDTMATEFCLEKKIPTSLKKGRKATGMIVLDVPKEAFTLAYEDMWGGDGWEIEVPAK